MAKAQDKKKSKDKKKTKATTAMSSSPVQLLAQATDLLQQGQPDLALQPAQSALTALQASNGPSSPLTLPALTLVAEIHLDLGDVESASQFFTTAVGIDPDGAIPESQGGGPDKFLNLAQLDETGGRQSLKWFQKAVACLEREVSVLDEKLERKQDDALVSERDEKRAKLAHALCAMCELWMTDLSFEDAAEENCERLITQAMMVASDDSQTLVTLASIRLSQQRVEEAQEALQQSLDLWKDLPTGHPDVPEFAARIALARALMEAGMDGAALEVCERLTGENDQSVEAWYLGGWCLYVYAEQAKEQGEDETMEEDAKEDDDDDDEETTLSADEKKAVLLSSREWLRNCLKLCELLEYEDDRLRDHATELVESLDDQLGDAEIEEIDEDEEWEGIESDDEDEDADEEMDES